MAEGKFRLIPGTTEMTVGMLRKSLEQLGSGYDNKPLRIWLPGSRIQLSTTILPNSDSDGGSVMIEGNVMLGSTLGEA